MDTSSLAIASNPPVVEGAVDLGSMLEDGTFRITSEQLLAKATDADGDTLSVVDLKLASGQGSITDNGDSSWTFSPDGDWLGLESATKLSKVPVRGGQPVALAEVRDIDTYGFSWGPDDVILVGARGGLYGVPASGGTAEMLVEVDETDRIFTNPQHKLTEDYITGRIG